MHKGRGGVAYEDLVVGDGAVAARGCTVELAYREKGVPDSIPPNAVLEVRVSLLRVQQADEGA
jgi:FKBP-type peptidyl-prolyl cis-trans isomerase